MAVLFESVISAYRVAVPMATVPSALGTALSFQLRERGYPAPTNGGIA